jgi:cytochrome c oxidase subunit 2
MTRIVLNRWAWLALGIVLVLAFPTRAWAHGTVEGGADADTVQGLFNITLWIATPVFLLVEGLLLYAIIRYRQRSPDEMPEQVHGNRSLEITWTVLSFLIIAVLFVLTARALQTDYQVEADSEDTTPDLTVHVTGYMFNWDYEYFLGDGEKTDVITTKYLTIPANRNVLLEITSSDVQHSFWVPKLAGKVDAVPGYTNTMWLKVSEPGTYHGQCAEYCGLNHYAMLIDVHVVEASEFFDFWMPEKMAAMAEFQPIGTDMFSPLPQGDEERGEQLFVELGCNACHNYDKDQPSGPSVQRMLDDAEAHEEYMPEVYLRESILKPCVELTKGYDQCIMPQDFGEKLDAQDLADLIEYLKGY